MSKIAIAEITNKLKVATSFKQIFGPETELKHQFRQLARMVHPDHAADCKKEAAEAFHLLNTLYKAAIESKDTYSQFFSAGYHFKEKKNPTTIQSPLGIYHLQNEPTYIGDYSNIYLAKRDKSNALVKIASIPEDNLKLEHEAIVLQKLNLVPKINKFIPKIIDTFIIPDGKGKKFRANVFEYKDGFLSITEIKKAFPDGLDPAQSSWIFRRLIAQAVNANMIDAVHASIIPDHVLVHPSSHEPLHIGWNHAILSPKKTNQKITTIIDRWEEFYPPEVFKKAIPNSQTDIYMIGKTMIYLLGGDTKNNIIPSKVPETMKRMIMQCVQKNSTDRPRNTLQYLQDFTTMIYSNWERKYRALVLP